MSGDVILSRTRGPSADEVHWSCTTGVVYWIRAFIAERVDDPDLAAELAVEIQYLMLYAYTDEQVRAIVRVILHDMPAGVDEAFAHSPGGQAEVRELIAMVDQWAHRYGFAD
ncbi:hypothetical protein JOD54_005172 [Actinokineospora baliensis]|uniref:hypothetical protein n=1 Tax=Actinokineospora baliensis TaxID=547056 RepID=UPI0019576951|nr:hypothetical protein [Actinokineospora baliensis]MBM7774968.1 hypothetical protein [Actinokineospora baliensis]